MGPQRAPKTVVFTSTACCSWKIPGVSSSKVQAEFLSHLLSPWCHGFGVLGSPIGKETPIFFLADLDLLCCLILTGPCCWLGVHWQPPTHNVQRWLKAAATESRLIWAESKGLSSKAKPYLRKFENLPEIQANMERTIKDLQSCSQIQVHKSAAQFTVRYGYPFTDTMSFGTIIVSKEEFLCTSFRLPIFHSKAWLRGRPEKQPVVVLWKILRI